MLDKWPKRFIIGLVLYYLGQAALLLFTQPDPNVRLMGVLSTILGILVAIRSSARIFLNEWSHSATVKIQFFYQGLASGIGYAGLVQIVVMMAALVSGIGSQAQNSSWLMPGMIVTILSGVMHIVLVHMNPQDKAKIASPTVNKSLTRRTLGPTLITIMVLIASFSIFVGRHLTSENPKHQEGNFSIAFGSAATYGKTLFMEMPEAWELRADNRLYSFTRTLYWVDVEKLIKIYQAGKQSGADFKLGTPLFTPFYSPDWKEIGGQYGLYVEKGKVGQFWTAYEEN